MTTDASWSAKASTMEAGFRNSDDCRRDRSNSVRSTLLGLPNMITTGRDVGRFKRNLQWSSRSSEIRPASST